MNNQKRIYDCTIGTILKKQKRVITILVVMLFCLPALWAQKNVIWNRPLMAYNRLSAMLSISKIEFADTATFLTFHADMRPHEKIGFTSETMLQADGKDYKAKGIKDYALNASIELPESGEMDVTIYFEPMPAGVSSITFNIPGAFTLNDIRDRFGKKEGITDTYWRNDMTGDWILGVGKDHIVYDSKVWDITSLTEKKGAYTINAKSANDNIAINIDKEKKGQRTISIGAEKNVCSMITDDYLPDYPTKDDRTELADNGYRMGDSITITGWYKDIPKELLEQSAELSAEYNGIFTNSEKKFSTKVDSLGRFTLKMPVENTQMPLCDLGTNCIFLVVEPGETYFLMIDFKEGKTLFMGKDVRLQNEMLANDLSFKTGDRENLKKLGGAMPFLAQSDSLMKVALSKLDTQCKEHPKLSARYEKLYRNIIFTEFAMDLMQGRFEVDTYDLPEEYVDYVTKNCWNKIEEPFTAHNNYPTFFRDYSDILQSHLSQDKENVWRYSLLKAEKDGKIKLSDADKTLIDEYAAGMKAVSKKIAEAPDSMKQQIAHEFNTGKLVKGLDEILTRDGVQNAVESYVNLYEYEMLLAATDSLGWSQMQKDILLASKLYRRIDHDRKPLSPSLLEYADANIRSKAAKQTIHEINDKYEAIGKRAFIEDNLKSSDNLKDLSEGEQILKKILEPYRGKLVLLDIWGTWCSPCKEGLSHSQEEYESLKDFPIVYLYLANRSDDESWRNVIKEYNVTGDNVVHYNLPKAQQNAIEKYLQVKGFPTYKLFDQQGNLVDINADPHHNLDSLKDIFKRLIK